MTTRELLDLADEGLRTMWPDSESRVWSTERVVAIATLALASAIHDQNETKDGE